MEFAAAVIVVFVVSPSLMVMARRSHRRGDTVGRFSAATDALRSIAEHPNAEVPPGMDHVEETPSVHMLEESRIMSLDPALLPLPERRKPARPNADVLARRTTISIN
jgi:hypothetical protein